MKRFIITMLSFLFCLNLFAQNGYYIFIQQDAGQPFYVRMGEKSFSSSAGGHIILAGLQDSVYNLYLGFPKNGGLEQLFEVALHRKDRGFELKNMNGEWELFDLQSLEFIKGLPFRDQGGDMSGTKKSDSYSQLMAGVVGDSAVLYNNSLIRKDEPASKDMQVKQKDIGEGSKTVVIDKDVIHPKKDKDIVRYESENMDEGKMIIYIDRTVAVPDTIRIVIPRL